LRTGCPQAREVVCAIVLVVFVLLSELEGPVERAAEKAEGAKNAEKTPAVLGDGEPSPPPA
jgi:hypothetical protein